MSVAGPEPPPGPRGLAVTGFFGGGSFAKTLDYFEDVARRYGPIASFNILGRRLHLVTGPTLVREVLVIQQQRFTRANGAVILRDLLGASMITVDEPRHREQRRVLQPAFHAQRIAAYGAVMLDETQRATAAWHDGEAVDVSAAMTRLALAIVGRTLFGGDVRGADALHESLGQAMRVVSWLGPILEAVPPWANSLRLRLPLPANAQLARARREMCAVVERLIALRRGGADAGDDVLSMLLAMRNAAGEALDSQAVADELVALLLAGHETTANALAWAWYLLARHPAIEARLAAEVRAAAGEPGAVTVADVPRLPLAARVFAEALRLYPPASAFGRRALEPCALGGYAIRPGDGILLSPYVSHRDPSIFAAPQTFEPDRWLDAPPPPFAYFPFGGGSRVCIGEAFARMEGTLVLAAVTQRFALRAVTAEPVGIAAHATLRPARPIVLRVERRRS